MTTPAAPRETACTAIVGYVDRTVEAVVLLNAVESRSHDLWLWRRWYRSQPNWGHWLDLARANDAELRALLRLRRQARRIAEAGPDPVDEYKGWAESERAWGR